MICPYVYHKDIPHHEPETKMHLKRVFMVIEIRVQIVRVHCKMEYNHTRKNTSRASFVVGYS